MLSASRARGIGVRGAAASILAAGCVLAAAPTSASTEAPLAPASRTAFAWSRVPPGVASSGVASHLRVDGVPLQVIEVRSSLPRDEVVERWRRWWAASAPGIVESQAAGWRVLSIRRDGAQFTVQLRTGAEGHTEGYVAAASPARARIAQRRGESPLRLPAGARVLREVESADGGRSATQTVIAMSASAAATLASLTRAAEAVGWTVGPAGHAALQSPRGGEPRGLWFFRNGEELAVFVQPARSGSLALVHRAGAPGDVRRGN